MRVIAIESIENGVMRSYGEGEYLGEKIPNVSPFNEIGLKNPCIKLDNGKYIWGFQCWWGEAKKFREKYKNRFDNEVIVDIEENINPVELK